MTYETQDMVVMEQLEAFLEDLDTTTPLLELGADLLSATNSAINSINSQRTKDEPKIKTLSALLPVQVAGIIQKTNHIIRIDYSKYGSDRESSPLAMYVADGPGAGIYTTEVELIARIIKEIAPSQGIRFKDEVVAILKMEAPQKQRESNENLIPLNNAIYDYRHKILMDFDPEYIFISKSNVDYNPSATDKVIKNPDGTDWTFLSWLDELSDEPEFSTLILQILGACLRSNCSWNKAAFLYSTVGMNGKGTVAELARNLLGHQSSASIPLADMGKDFSLDALRYASAIIVDENDVGTYIDKAANLKAIITGDALAVNAKFKPIMSVSFKGMMIQCLNALPKVKDKSNSLLRRMIFLPFTKSFVGQEKKYIKDDYLKRPEVLEFVVKYVLEDLPDYYEIIEPEFTKHALEEFRESNDPVIEFINDFNELATWDMISWQWLYKFFQGWCKEYGTDMSGKNLKSSDFKKSIKTLIDYGQLEGWEYRDSKDGDSPFYTSNSNLDEPEPLLYEYKVTDLWGQNMRINQRIDPKRDAFVDRVPDRMHGIARVGATNGGN